MVVPSKISNNNLLENNRLFLDKTYFGILIYQLQN